MADYMIGMRSSTITSRGASVPTVAVPLDRMLQRIAFVSIIFVITALSAYQIPVASSWSELAVANSFRVHDLLPHQLPSVLAIVCALSLVSRPPRNRMIVGWACANAGMALLAIATWPDFVSGR